jgi:hypothetical protein
MDYRHSGTILGTDIPIINTNNDTPKQVLKILIYFLCWM